MARLRVRDTTNLRWLDICSSEYFVRNKANNGWIRLQANGFLAIRSGDNRNWMAITCTDPSTDRCVDPTAGDEDNIEYCE